MNEPTDTPIDPAAAPPPSQRVRRGWKLKTKVIVVLVILAPFIVFGLYVWGSYTWAYSTGERAGYVQKFSKKGWLCKTWEGELAMSNIPGSIPEKFFFTVRDDGVAQHVNQTMGQRVSLSYEQHKGLPGSCFGESEYFVNAVRPIPQP